jgi:Xaa-Pro aminopeptidase
MAKITGAGKALEAGRFGHGLGMQLTEWPSFIPDDHTEILEGMVLTLEPSIETIDGRIMVHEENIVIRKDGAEKLSTFYKEMVIIE